MSRSLIILTLNERDGVDLYRDFLADPPCEEVIAVDGGSSDGTRARLQALGIPVFHQERKGRGEAFRVGTRHCRGEYLVFFSPDGNEDPQDVERLFAALEEGADMSIASRFLPGSVNEEDGQILPLRKWVNQAFTRIANLIWNRRGAFISDTINGFRGLRREAFERLSPISLRFTIEYELSIKAMKYGLKVAEIATHEGQRAGGESKALSFAVGVDFLRFLFTQICTDIANHFAGLKGPTRPTFPSCHERR